MSVGRSAPSGTTTITSPGAGDEATSEAISRDTAASSPRHGMTTLTASPASVPGALPSLGASSARCGIAACGTARASTPIRARCSLTARACSSGTPSFCSAPAAMLPGIARQW